MIFNGTNISYLQNGNLIQSNPYLSGITDAQYFYLNSVGIFVAPCTISNIKGYTVPSYTGSTGDTGPTGPTGTFSGNLNQNLNVSPYELLFDDANNSGSISYTSSGQIEISTNAINQGILLSNNNNVTSFYADSSSNLNLGDNGLTTTGIISAGTFNGLNSNSFLSAFTPATTPSGLVFGSNFYIVVIYNIVYITPVLYPFGSGGVSGKTFSFTNTNNSYTILLQDSSLNAYAPLYEYNTPITCFYENLQGTIESGLVTLVVSIINDELSILIYAYQYGISTFSLSGTYYVILPSMSWVCNNPP